MFKFDFVQDSDNNRTQATHGEKKEANELTLTEISLIELVCIPGLSLLETVTMILFS